MGTKACTIGSRFTSVFRQRFKIFKTILNRGLDDLSLQTLVMREPMKLKISLIFMRESNGIKMAD